jgi:hypothetical protein
VDKPRPQWDSIDAARTELSAINAAVMDAVEVILLDIMKAMPTMPQAIKDMAVACYEAAVDIKAEDTHDDKAGDTRTAYIAAQNVIVLRWMSVRMAMAMKRATRGKVPPMLNRIIQLLVQATANQFVYESKLYPWSDEVGFIEAATVSHQYMEKFRNALTDAIGVGRVKEEDLVDDSEDL